MILGKLVNKFKRQTINDGLSCSPPKSVASAPAICDPTAAKGTRKSARLNPGLFQDAKVSSSSSSTSCASPKPLGLPSKKFPLERVEFGGDCGESDDDELEQLEKMSNASLGIGSVSSSEQNVCGQSPPVLTSSPPLVSEIDTNSWDSAGCESGIVLRESVERDDSSRNLDLLDDDEDDDDDDEEPLGDDGEAATPVERRDGFPVDFSALHAELAASRNSSTTNSITAGSNSTSNCSGSKKELPPPSGAFHPVLATTAPAVSPTPLGEKRRWGSCGLTRTSPVMASPIASRTRSALAHQETLEAPRVTLTARRTRVKVLFHDPHPRRSAPINMPVSGKLETEGVPTGVLSESPPNNILHKRGRHCKAERPSLDFDKMREQMMRQVDNGGCVPDSENTPLCRNALSTPDFGRPFSSTE